MKNTPKHRVTSPLKTKGSEELTADLLTKAAVVPTFILLYLYAFILFGLKGFIHEHFSHTELVKKPQKYLVIFF